ncbi:MAG: hypothetical protein R2681_11730 [Pyrinomonadaceae bacterium]
MEQIIENNDIEKLIFVPLFASLYYEDRVFAKRVCIKLASHSTPDVRGCAIEGFGHIARIDGEIDEKLVRPLIERALFEENEFVRMKAEDAKDELKHFLNWKF